LYFLVFYLLAHSPYSCSTHSSTCCRTRYVNRNNPGATAADTTLLGGIRAEFPAGARVVLSAGCANTSCATLDPATVALLRGQQQGRGAAAAAAVRAAEGQRQPTPTCDLLLLAMGLTADARAPSPPEGGRNACGCRHDDAVEGECCDRASDALPGQQLALVQLAAAAPVPTVLLSVNAGQVDLRWAVAAPGVHAILNLIYPGQAAGRAAAQLLLGKRTSSGGDGDGDGNDGDDGDDDADDDGSPAARLPITWYDDMEAAGSLTDYRMHARTYRYSAAKATFPFGFGLSYTTFTYGAPRWAVLPAVAAEGGAGGATAAAAAAPAAPVATVLPAGGVPAVGACDALALTVTVTNVGARASDEVVQLYLSLPRNSSVPVPARQLSSFARVRVAAGEARDVTFTIVPEDHAVMRGGDAGADFAPVLEPGVRHVWVGGCSSAALPGVATAFRVDRPAGQTLLHSCARGRAMQWWNSSTNDAARWSPNV